ncbi:unnamed protein product [Polarella glacialis]|uniref:Uncharacterized protein n=1 Tax=Polarella glacialis TaxID=89957 RepID=A0A813DF06_POLGL|nr:unnamed protein product [Polarella glacialis]
MATTGKQAEKEFDGGQFGRWLRMMLVSFYSDEEAVVADLLFRRAAMLKDTVLARILNLPERQVRQVLESRLVPDCIIERILEGSGERTHTFYRIAPAAAAVAAKRLQKLEDSLTNKAEDSYLCQKCDRSYTSLQAMALTSGRGRSGAFAFLCETCGQELSTGAGDASLLQAPAAKPAPKALAGPSPLAAKPAEVSTKGEGKGKLKAACPNVHLDTRVAEEAVRFAREEVELILCERGVRRSSDGGAWEYSHDPQLQYDFSMRSGIPPLEVRKEMAKAITAQVLWVRTQSAREFLQFTYAADFTNLLVADVQGTHFVHLQNPKVVADLVRRFFQGDSSAGIPLEGAKSCL